MSGLDPGSETVLVRVAAPDDIPRLHAINEASTPGVGPLSYSGLADLVGMGSLSLVAEIGGEVGGFLLAMTEGTAYQSPNYLWIAGRYPSFAYCDRIAVAPEVRSRSIGERLYREAFRRLSGTRDMILCEVNLAPPNPGSLRFHERLGFHPVGEAWSPDRTKGVVYLERCLD